MRRLSICLVIVLAVLQSAAGQDDLSTIPMREGETYQIWSVAHSSGVKKKRGLFRRWRYAEWDDLVVGGIYGSEDNVRRLPREAKTVVALYSELIPYYLLADNDSERELADVLGGFSSLAQAQADLLAGWNGPKPPSTPHTLNIMQRGDTIYVDLSARSGRRVLLDKFALDGSGGVSYIPEVVRSEPYDRGALYDKYYDRESYSFFLNGTKEEYFFLYHYLDPENVESVAVSDRTRTVFIEQKDKNPRWFSLSDIDITKTFTGEKSIKDVDFIQIEDVEGLYDQFSPGKTKIEYSMVKSVGSDRSESGLSWIEIRLKKPFDR